MKTFSKYLFCLLAPAILIQCDDAPEANTDYARGRLWIENAISSLPMLGSGLDIDNISTSLTVNTPDQDDDGDLQNFDVLNEVLDFQCHFDSASFKLQFCPEGTSQTQANEFSENTINGLLARSLFDIYTYYPDNLDFKSCQSTTLSTDIMGAIEFTPEEQTNLHLLDEDLWACYEEKTSLDSEQVHTLFSQSNSDLTFGLTQYRLNGQVDGVSQNKMIETYARRSSSASETFSAVAWNISITKDATIADALDTSQRLTLILNPESRKFILKYAKFSRPADTTDPYTASSEIIAMGTGGYDTQNKVFLSGEYLIKSRVINDEDYFERNYCVQSNDAPSFASTCNSIASDIDLFFDNADGYFSTNGLFDFLNLTTEDQTALASFSSIFDQPNYFELSQMPFAASFPTSIVNNDDADDEDDS